MAFPGSGLTKGCFERSVVTSNLVFSAPQPGAAAVSVGAFCAEEIVAKARKRSAVRVFMLQHSISAYTLRDNRVPAVEYLKYRRKCSEDGYRINGRYGARGNV